MKRILLVFLLVCGVAFATQISPGLFNAPGNAMFRGSMITAASSSMNPSTSITITGATEKVAWKFMVTKTVTITHWDMYCDITGDMTGVLLQAHVETDSADVPTGTTVGTGSTTIAAPMADGFTGSCAMGASVTLSPNTYYWFIVEDGGGTAPTGSNWIQTISYGGTNNIINSGRARKWNGTNWTTVSSTGADGNHILKTSNNEYIGNAWTGPLANPSSTAEYIYGTYRKGLKFRLGGKEKMAGALCRLGKSGTPPGVLEVSFYAGSTLIETVNIAVATVIDGRFMYVTLTTPYQTAAGVDYYIYFHQAGDAGSTTHRYQHARGLYNTTYKDAMMPAGWSVVYGTTADPTGFSEATGEVIGVFPFMQDPVADFGASSGGQASYGSAN